MRQACERGGLRATGRTFGRTFGRTLAGSLLTGLMGCLVAVHASEPASATPPPATVPATTPATAATVPVPGTVAAVSSYQFPSVGAATYEFTLKDAVGMQTAGDTLSANTTITWWFAVEAKALAARRVELHVTFLHIKAWYDGTGTSHHYDDEPPGLGANDPLFGYLKALKLAELFVMVDPATGAVDEVRGSDKIVQALDDLSPSQDPAEPSPLHEDNVRAFGPQALTYFWNSLLHLAPLAGVEDTMVLGPPFPKASLQRHWRGDAYVVSLPAGSKLTAQVLTNPQVLDVTVTSLLGAGRQQVLNGMPASNGQLVYDLNFTALTQPMQQHHQMSWALRKTR